MTSPAEATPRPILAVRDVSRSFGSHCALAQVTFDLDEGEIGCLLGPSGGGKTTLLRAIAGFESIDGGTIHVDSRLMSRPQWLAQVPPEKRGVGMVFQNGALFPHLTVAANITFGLFNMPQVGQRARLRQLLELVHLSGLEHRYPHQISGGQQQRVALARALAPYPRLLLMDEPFSNLDVDLRERLSLEVRAILKSEAITALIVTHDQSEAFALADRTGLLHQGVIQQWDTPYELYHRPHNRCVADFVGQRAWLTGRILANGQVETELGVFSSTTATTPGAQVDVLLRPDDIVRDDGSPVTALVEQKLFRGGKSLYTLRLPSGATILSLLPSQYCHATAERIGIRMATTQVVVFPHDENPANAFNQQPGPTVFTAPSSSIGYAPE